MQQNPPNRRPHVAIEILDPEYCNTLTHALHNVLSTNLAEVTCAQLIDGLPMIHTTWEMRGYTLNYKHPLQKHEKLCKGALERAQKFRDEFDPAVLRFDSLVIRRYQNAAPGSREFKMRLVELVAAAIHQIAVILFQSDDKLHTKEHIHTVVSWKKESEWVDMGHRNPVLFESRDPHPTLFYHCEYMDHQQYPHGLADVAGYWAEDRILGGIAVFDRGKSGAECNDIYLHSAREQYTPRVWRLLDSQFET
ncbi:hypothetical protein C7999DRAFT_32283 [Corynascus novoguineensis]|uniref:Uncharacterized protein n=1 Tax=Corynascus novoguineensis TaxID=1126955 RepID=A0AAN7HF51_9PEZI|nr:hypothetical protein C7999DRAFT_32283 [Corynascus novoguineensis]